MSCMDILSSVANSLSTIPSPSHIDHELSMMRFPGLGNTATCTAQGFFYHSGQTGTTLYYCVLSIYFVIVARNYAAAQSNQKKNNKGGRIISRSMEFLLHFIPLSFSFCAAIFLALTGSFNNATTVCWIAPYPFSCRKEPETCERGQNAIFYRIIFTAIPIIIVFAIILVCMILLICIAR